MKSDRPAQIGNLLERIRESVKTGNYIVRKHALERLNERAISLKDIGHVLIRGYHEKEKTSFDSLFQTWKYSIRGRTMDGLDVRVIVSFVEMMAIITVIRLEKWRK